MYGTEECGAENTLPIRLNISCTIKGATAQRPCTIFVGKCLFDVCFWINQIPYVSSRINFLILLLAGERVKAHTMPHIRSKRMVIHIRSHIISVWCVYRIATNFSHFLNSFFRHFSERTPFTSNESNSLNYPYTHASVHAAHPSGVLPHSPFTIIGWIYCSYRLLLHGVGMNFASAHIIRMICLHWFCANHFL